MSKRIPEGIIQILDEARIILKGIYGDRLKKIILYGSYARGEGDADSDIDLIILLENMKDVCEEIDRCYREIGELDLKHDTLISLIPIDEEEFRSWKLPLIMNAKKEGIYI